MDFLFWSKFHWEICKGPIYDIPGLVQIYGLAPYMREGIIWTNAGLFDWRVYVTRGSMS